MVQWLLRGNGKKPAQFGIFVAIRNSESGTYYRKVN